MQRANWLRCLLSTVYPDFQKQQRGTHTPNPPPLPVPSNCLPFVLSWVGTHHIGKFSLHKRFKISLQPRSIIRHNLTQCRYCVCVGIGRTPQPDTQPTAVRPALTRRPDWRCPAQGRPAGRGTVSDSGSQFKSGGPGYERRKLLRMNANLSEFSTQQKNEFP